MRSLKTYWNKLSVIKTFQIKWLAASVIIWTICDFYLFTRWLVHSVYLRETLSIDKEFTIGLGIAVSIFINSIIGLVLMYGIPYIREKKHPILARLLKILIVFAVIGILDLTGYALIISMVKELRLQNFLVDIRKYMATDIFLPDAIFIKALMVLIIQLLYLIGQKYTPGFFLKMMLGSFTAPRNEDRIIMFIDLKDSTPISEKLGHQKYFLFIRDFIFLISNAALRNNGDIYQYVGDEVIVTWPKRKRNSSRCINTLILSQRQVKRKAGYFERTYGVVPEFRVGINAGTVTIGEIGSVKKDIAISGEAMNLTARIRSACSELNQKYIVSQDYFDFTNLKEWQGEDLGIISLKGIENRDIRLYALKI